MTLDPSRFSVVNQVIFPLAMASPAGIQLLGTAFLTSVPGRFITAAHALVQNAQKFFLILPKGSIFDYQDTSEAQQVTMIEARIVTHNPFRDLCVLQADTLAVSTLAIGSTDDLSIGSEIISFGFPHSDFGRMVLTFQHAEVGAKVLIDSSGIKSKHIVLNTQTRPGQSGSPIFRIPDLRLVAVLIGSYAPGGGGMMSMGGVDPHTLHQTTHAVSGEYISEMLNL